MRKHNKPTAPFFLNLKPLQSTAERLWLWRAGIKYMLAKVCSRALFEPIPVTALTPSDCRNS